MIDSGDFQGLLYGFLALQNNFISREDLIAAVSVWLQDKSKSLGQILRDRKSLRDEEFQLVDALARLHLKKHNDDPEKSLAAISSLGSVAEELKQFCDPQMQASLAAMGAIHGTLDAQDDRTLMPQQGTEAVRFRILRPHARGGLGQVFVARDAELNREIALKEIHLSHSHDKECRSRFVLEAEVTGGLEHPGIVPVYGLGQYADGRPYYAMRFIRGDSLKEAIERFHAGDKRPLSSAEKTEHALQLRNLLGRFVDVCNAIQYAHSRGVLHRDLKPGNIMLGKYGETLVVDWGLAKVRDKDDKFSTEGETSLQPSSLGSSNPTLQGRAIGTPAYMPPEQAAGRLHELGPASDVYSLGATLYHLLAGQPAFTDRETTTVLRRVQQGDFPPPRSIIPNVPEPLQAICLRAMATKPSERYPTPQHLADDVERFLADEPVTSYAEPFGARARRWVRKHPVFTATSAAVLALSALGLVVFTIVIGGKNAQLTALNTSLDQKNVELTESGERETAARILAETNATAAQEQSQLALTTLGSVVSNIQVGLKNVTGGGEIRRRLLAASLEQLQKVAAKYVEQSAVDRNSMIGLIELGDVVLQFGKGDRDAISAAVTAEPRLAAEEKTALTLARSLYERAFTIAVKLAETAPVDVQATHDLLTAYDSLGDVSLQLGAISDAQKFYQEGLKIAEPLAKASPDNHQLSWDLSICCNNLGDLSLRLNKIQQALEYYRQAWEIRNAATPASSADSSIQFDRAASLKRLGNVTERVGDLPQAIEHYRQMKDIIEGLLRDDPNSVRARFALAVALQSLGDATFELGTIPDSATWYREALKASELLAESDPNDARSQRTLWYSLYRSGDVSLRSGEAQQASTYYVRALEIARKLAEADPANAGAQADLTGSYTRLGDWSLQEGQTQQASENYRKAQETAERLATADPTDAEAQRDLAISWANLGIVSLQTGETQPALEYARKAFEIRQRLASVDPTDVRAQRDLSISCMALGQASLQADDIPQARNICRQALDINQRLATANPNDTQAQRELAISYSRLGDVELQADDLPQAVGYYRQALELLERLAAANPADAEAQHDLVFGHSQLAEALELQRDYVGAGNAWEKSSREFVTLARFPEAAQAAAKLRDSDNATKDQLYSAACVFSLCAASVIPPDGKELTEEQSQQRQAWISDALATLRKSIAAGRSDFTVMQQDPELSVLHDLPEFKSLFPAGAM